MKLVKAKTSDETVTIELTFDELMVVTDIIADSSENYEDDDLYDVISRDFQQLSTDILILDNAMRKVGVK